MVKKAAFLDRDGTINRMLEGDYVKTWEEFQFLPGAAEAIRTLKAKGYLVIIVTNQSGISRGIMTEEDLREVHRRMREELAATGAQIDGIVHCPHAPQDGCACRKPKPGLLLEAKAKWGIDLAGSVLIGDMETDMEAGRTVGCNTIKVCTNKGIAPEDLEALP